MSVVGLLDGVSDLRLIIQHPHIDPRIVDLCMVYNMIAVSFGWKQSIFNDSILPFCEKYIMQGSSLRFLIEERNIHLNNVLWTIFLVLTA